MPRLAPVATLSALVAATLLLSGCDAGITTAIPTATGGPAAVAALPAPTAAAGDFAGLLNAARANAGLPAAVADAALTTAAQAFAQDMVARDYFSHTSPGGGTLGTRLASAGFAQCGAGENIFYGNASPNGAFASWLTSPPHRANLLLAGAARYGLGQAGDKTVLIIGRPC